ncbi:MAG TPA: hypothetical protein VEA63_08650, partial [Opitutus sp.]|nr:hypothetical protein [Opitutus sp.]
TSGTTVRTFTIRNLGPGNLTIGSVTVSPSTDFTLLHQPATSITPMHAPIWSDGRTTFSIQFNPTATGARTATVSFTNSDGDEGSFSFQIRGTGAAATANPFKTTFPRLAGIFYNKSYSDTAYQQRIAKRDLAVLSFDKGWGGGGSTMLPANAAVNAIKAINPNILLGQYTLLESQYDHGPSTPAIDDIIDKLYAENWWILDGSGNKVTELYYNNMFMTNFTSYTTTDANGDRYPEYLAKRHNTEIVDPISGLDFWFSDNAFYLPRKDVDWQQNGGADTDAVTLHEYRLAMASYWAKINQLQPGHFVLGNSDGQPSDKLGFLRDPEYQRKLQAAQFETALGASSSPEGYSGWYNMMTAYRSQLDNTLAPHLVIIGALSTATDGKAGHVG